MADSTLSNLTATTTLTDSDEFYVNDGGVSKKITKQYLDDNIDIALSQVNDVTATAAELNKLDGVTASTAELNLLDGVTLTTTQINNAVQNTGDTITGALVLNAVVPQLQLVEDGVTADNTTWLVLADSENFYIRAYDDAVSSSSTAISISRTGTDIDIISFDAADNVNFLKDQLSIASTAVTTTAAELNILDGVTATTAEINKLDGVTLTTAQINAAVQNTGDTMTGPFINEGDIPQIRWKETGHTSPTDETIWIALSDSGNWSLRAYDDAVSAQSTAISVVRDGTDITAVQFSDAGYVDCPSLRLNGTSVDTASTSAKGFVELATNAETIAGTDTTRAVTPDGVQAVLDEYEIGQAVTAGTTYVLGAYAHSRTLSAGDPATTQKTHSSWRIWGAGGFRLAWTITAASGTPTSQVYKNGVAQGSSSSGTGAKTQDITGVAVGDLVEIRFNNNIDQDITCSDATLKGTALCQVTFTERAGN